jgi:signal transduction histidine kinase
MRNTLRQAARSSRYLLAGGVTATACAIALALIAMLFGSYVFVGVFVVPLVVTADRWVADWERRRAGALLGRPIERTYVALRETGDPPGPRGWPRRWLLMFGRAMSDPTSYRDALWITVHTIVGTAFAAVTLVLWVEVIGAASLPIQWALAATGVRPPNWRPWVWEAVLAPFAVAALLWATPLFARGEARVAAVLLGPPARQRLATRVKQLAQSRAEALDAHSAELRRIERNLHDGAQAEIVSVALLLGVAQRQLEQHGLTDPATVGGLVRQARESAEGALVDLRELVRGMYPPILADRGLEGAIEALAARGPVPVSLRVRPVGRLPAALEAAAYFIVTEALTNVSRHSAAGRAVVDLKREHRSLRIQVFDDGVGGADEARGTGLRGIRGRVAAFDGRVELSSPPGGPTTLLVEIPCES